MRIKILKAHRDEMNRNFVEGQFYLLDAEDAEAKIEAGLAISEEEHEAQLAAAAQEGK
jgi:hypothetical protein